MGILDDREKAQENKYFHDQELRFKVVARRNKLFGHWAADRMGLKGAAADAYAAEVAKADMKEAGDDDVIAKVRKDLDAKGTILSPEELKATLAGFLDQAVAEVEAGK